MGKFLFCARICSSHVHLNWDGISVTEKFNPKRRQSISYWNESFHYASNGAFSKNVNRFETSELQISIFLKSLIMKNQSEKIESISESDVFLPYILLTRRFWNAFNYTRGKKGENKADHRDGYILTLFWFDLMILRRKRTKLGIYILKKKIKFFWSKKLLLRLSHSVGLKVPEQSDPVRFSQIFSDSKSTAFIADCSLISHLCPSTTMRYTRNRLWSKLISRHI